MDEWVNIFFNNAEGEWGIIGLALIAVLAQTASSEKPSLYGFLVTLPMSFFVVWMAWLGGGHLGLGDRMQIFWSGIAAFGAPWILRGINVILQQFMEDPISFLAKIKSVWRRR